MCHIHLNHMFTLVSRSQCLQKRWNCIVLHVAKSVMKSCYLSRSPVLIWLFNFLWNNFHSHPWVKVSKDLSSIPQLQRQLGKRQLGMAKVHQLTDMWPYTRIFFPFQSNITVALLCVLFLLQSLWTDFPLTCSSRMLWSSQSLWWLRLSDYCWYYGISYGDCCYGQTNP